MPLAMAVRRRGGFGLDQGVCLQMTVQCQGMRMLLALDHFPGQQHELQVGFRPRNYLLR